MIMLNRKGFTLIEILAVVTILGIVAVISFVAIDGVLEHSEVVECENIYSTLENATKEYISDNRYVISGNTYSFYVDKLITGKYVRSKIVNPFTNKDAGNSFKNKIIIVELYNDITVKNIIIDFIKCEDKIFPN